MNKIKIITIAFVGMLISTGLISLAGAQDVVLDGHIRAELDPDQPIGIVNPSFNITLEQEKDVILEDIDGNLSANVTLCINVETDKTGDLVLPRYLLARVVVVYSNRSRFGFPNLNIFHQSEKSNFQPVQLDNEGTNGTIKMKLTKINKDVNFSKVSSEKITVWIWTMGLFPGKVSYPCGESENLYYSLFRPLLPKFMGLHVVEVDLNYLALL